MAARFLRQSEAAPLQPRKRCITYRTGFASYFNAVCTPTRPVAEVNKQERGLEYTELEENIRSVDWKPSLVPPRTVAVHS